MNSVFIANPTFKIGEKTHQMPSKMRRYDFRVQKSASAAIALERLNPFAFLPF